MRWRLCIAGNVKLSTVSDCTGPVAQRTETTLPGTVRVIREGFGIELRRGSFEILIDGTRAGSIDYGQTVELPVEPGQHALRIRRGRYSSRALSFDATDGKAVIFRCHGAMIWPRWLLSFAVPGLAISLGRE